LVVFDNHRLVVFDDDSRTGFEHLLVPFDGICWWCKHQPANSREHKYKRSDLKRMWGPGGLLWGNGDGDIRTIHGIDRNPTVKFHQTMCSSCNNARSQPFDRAYAIFSDYVAANHRRLWHGSGIDFTKIYGNTWRQSQLDMARYYGKHFGCRLAQAGLPVPESLRNFLDGAPDMHDIHLALVSNRSIRRDRPKSAGLTLGPDLAYMNKDRTRIVQVILASYVSYIGVRYYWDELSLWSKGGSSFFGYPKPILNRFRDDDEVGVKGIRR
jgi:hypothetical protein